MSDELRIKFKQYDLDGNGKLSKKELEAAGIANIFEGYLGGDEVSEEDFYSMMNFAAKSAGTSEKPPINHVPTMEEYNASGRYGLDLATQKPLAPELDFSNSSDLLRVTSFDDKTFSGGNKMPPGYEPQRVMELGKNPGLNIRAMQDMGYTGKGVRIAIMDWKLKPHENYDSNIINYEEMDNAKNMRNTFHGSSVTSIVVGKKTGVAPDANVMYFAETQISNVEQGNDMIQALNRVKEINAKAGDADKIRVISISGPPYGGEEADKLIQELNDSGTWVLTSHEFWKDFGYLEKKDPMGNPDDFDNYNVWNNGGNKDALLVNSGDRTVAGDFDDNTYRHDSVASASWAIPVVAGLYAAACQADPSMTPEKFKALARESAQVRSLQTAQLKHNGNDTAELTGYSEPQPANIIDAKALIQLVLQKKNQD